MARSRPSFLQQLREAPPVFKISVLAGGFIRAIEAGLSPLLLVGPEIEKRLRPHAEQLSDRTSLRRGEQQRLAALLWLIGAPETELVPTEDLEPWDQGLPPDVPALWGLRPDTQTPPETAEACAAVADPMSHSGTERAEAFAVLIAGRGAH